MWVTIDITVNSIPKKLALCAVYLPPPSKLETLNQFLENSTDVLNHFDDAIIIGDFNMRFIKWSKVDSTSQLTPSNYNCGLGYSLIDFISVNALGQFNNLYNSDNVLLDLILSNIDDIKITPAPPLIVSDKSILNVNEMVAAFYKILKNYIESHVPKRKPYFSKHPPWFIPN
ncbi:hypothetical protein OBRU01_14726 [Operophtera brumata]|uniref:Endonuclease/exonuclease/phosphatase domain-containing protein n=1 Tax=Operophtera brumata TaxID=104452 RepID=A0A0L7L5W6_OPEBR|nr:hypothetical protein OBRU01_14726 [Operophtera brumata]